MTRQQVGIILLAIFCTAFLVLWITSNLPVSSFILLKVVSEESIENLEHSPRNESICDGLPTIERATGPGEVYYVNTTCDVFVERVKQFNIALDLFRSKMFGEYGLNVWNGTSNGTAKVVWGGDDDFMDQLVNYTHVKYLMLPWHWDKSSSRWNSTIDQSNVLYSEYYEWFGTDILCSWIETPGKLKMKYDATFNRACSRYSEAKLRSQSLEPVFLNMKPINRQGYWPNNGTSFPKHFYERPPSFVFYIHVITDAIVMCDSGVYSHNVKFLPYGCGPSLDPKIPSNSITRPLYDEIFVISQYWGSSIFHRILEIVPRLGSSLDFLKRHPEIRILTPEGPGGRLGEIFKILGLSTNRMVNEWGRAKIAYVPRPSFCGMASLQETQIISSIYHRYIVEKLGALQRNKLILIRRSGSRRFTEHDAIEKLLKALAVKYGLEFAMFIDNPVPSLNETMRMFHAAVMVVAPHGAGLSNIVFSQPGTYVIEGVCDSAHVNLCFQRTAVILAHHWHGIPGRRGCLNVIDVPATEIASIAELYLTHMKDNSAL